MTPIGGRVLAMTLAVICGAPFHSESEAGTPMTRDEAVAFLAPSVPKNGWIEIVFVLKYVKMMPRVVGLDYASGACYQAQEGFVWGVDPGGSTYRGQARPSGLARSSDPNEAVTTDTITLSIPTVVAMDLVRKPELISRAERRDDGGIDVWSELAEGRRWPVAGAEGPAVRRFTFKWEFDERARLKRYSSDMNKLAPEFEYLTDGPEEVDICTNAGYPQSYRLFSYNWYPHADPSQLRMAAVESRMVAIDMLSFDDPKRKGMSVEQARDIAASRQDGGAAPGQVRWMFVIVGALCAAIAGSWFYLKRRQA